MLAEILEDGKVCLQYGRDATEFFRLRLKASDVESQIEIQRSANLYHLDVDDGNTPQSVRVRRL